MIMLCFGFVSLFQTILLPQAGLAHLHTIRSVISPFDVDNSESFPSSGPTQLLPKIPNVCHRVVGKTSSLARENFISYSERFPNTEQIIHQNSGEDYMKAFAPPSVYQVYKAIPSGY